jgi:hypothetical protein
MPLKIEMRPMTATSRRNLAGEDASNDAMLAELHGKLEELKEALAKDEPACDPDGEVADCMAALGAAFQEQKNIGRDAKYETEEESRGTEELCLS